MAEQFYTILTKIGKAKIANASALGAKVNFSKFQVGDSNGSYYNPTEDQTQLKHKVWEGNINSISVDENNPNWIVIEILLPSNIGGFMIREAAILDDENNMIAVAKYPETYKPITSEGSSKDLLIRTILEVSNTSSVTIKVDPTVILATKKDIEILENKIKNIKVPVTSINGKTGDVKLKAEDIRTVEGETLEEFKTLTNKSLGNIDDTVTTPLPLQGKDLVTRVNEVFTNASSGKQKVATALTGIGVGSSASETFTDLANKIGNIPKVGTISYTSFSSKEELDVTGTLESKIKNLSITSIKKVGTQRSDNTYDIDIKVSNGLESSDIRYKSYTKKVNTPKPLVGSKLLNLQNEIKFNEDTNNIEFIQRVGEGHTIPEKNPSVLYNYGYLSSISIAYYDDNIYYQRSGDPYDYELCCINLKTRTIQVGSRIDVYCYGIYAYNNSIYYLDKTSMYCVNPNLLTDYKIVTGLPELNNSVMSNEGIIYSCLSYNTKSINIFDLNSSEIGNIELSGTQSVYLVGVYNKKLFVLIDKILNVYDLNTKTMSLDAEVNLSASEYIDQITGNNVYIHDVSRLDAYDRIYNIDTKVSTATILTTRGTSGDTKLEVVGDRYYTMSPTVLQEVDRVKNEVISSRGYASLDSNYTYDRSYGAAGAYMLANDHNNFYSETFCTKTGKSITLDNQPSYTAKLSLRYKDNMFFKSNESYDGYAAKIFNSKTLSWISIPEGSYKNVRFGFADNKVVIYYGYGKKLHYWDMNTKSIVKTFTISNEIIFDSDNNPTVLDRYIYYIVSGIVYKLDAASTSISIAKLGPSPMSAFGSGTINYKDKYLLSFSREYINKYDIEFDKWSVVSLPTALNGFSVVDIVNDSVLLSYGNIIYIYNIILNTLDTYDIGYSGYSYIYKDRLYTVTDYAKKWHVRSVSIIGGANLNGGPVITKLDMDCNWNSYKHRTKIEVIGNKDYNISSDLNIEE